MKLGILIPAYNESSSIESVLSSLPKKMDGFESLAVIVVDDGSKDDTYDRARKISPYTVRHAVNLGVGAATQTGLEVAKRLKVDVLVTMDADGQHNPKDIKKMVEPIIKGKADVVIGTRMLNPKGMPLLKILGNHFMNALTFIVFGQWTSDSQSGMKGFSKKAIRKMKLHSIGYEVCSEMIGEIKRNKLSLVEVPITVIYSDYSKSRGQTWLNGINILTKIIAIKMQGKK